MKKNLFHYLLFFAFVLAVFPAQAGIIEFLFPSLKNTGPDPAKTLTAPFAEQAPSPVTGAAPSLPENAIPLDTAHRNNEQISDWLMSVVSEAMTFEQDNYQDTLNGLFHYFDDTGKQQYLAYLDQSSIMRVLQSNKYHIQGFVHDTPVLLNEGAIDGRYRWLYEVPVMVTYMDRNMHGYKNAQPVSQTITLTVQVGRTADLTIGKDLIIERWAAKAGAPVQQ